MTHKDKLIYVFDPLCTWCYAFSPILQQFCENHIGEFDISVISGGMVREINAGALKDVAPFLKTSIESVKSKSGISFGTSFLKNLESGEMIMDSRPMSYALCIVKKYQPEKQFEFASLLQKSIYLDGKHPCDEDNLLNLADIIGMDREIFANELNSEEIKYETNSDFQWVESLNISGFPALIVEKNEELFLMAKGYTPVEHLELVYNRIIEQG